MKIAILSNSTGYVKELERSIPMFGHTIAFEGTSVKDLQKNINSADSSFIIASDVLSEGTAEDVVQVAQGAGQISKLVFILKEPGTHEDMLQSHGVPFFYEDKIAPAEVIQKLPTMTSNLQQLGGGFGNPYQQTAYMPQYGQPQYGQQGMYEQPNPYGGQNPYGQPNQYGQPQFGQQGGMYGQPNPYNPYRQPNVNQRLSDKTEPYGTQNPYGQPNPYGQLQFGQQGMGQQNPGQQGPGQQQPQPQMPKNPENPYAFNPAPAQPQPQQAQPQPRQMHQSTLGNANAAMTFNTFKNTMIVINSPKGGVGKSTLAVELATELGARAKVTSLNPSSQLSHGSEMKVALVDLNPSFDTIASSLNCIRSRTGDYPTVLTWAKSINKKIYSSLSDEEKAQVDEGTTRISDFADDFDLRFSEEEAKSLMVYDDILNVYILPAVSLATDVRYVPPEYLRIILDTIKKHFEIAIVDTANNISSFTLESFYAADDVLLIVNPTMQTTAVVKKTLDVCEKAYSVDTSKFNLVFNYAYGPKNESTVAEENVSNAIEVPSVASIPYDPAVTASHMKGIPYAVNNQKTRYAEAVVRLAQQIAPLWKVKPGKGASGGKKKFSLFK